MNYETKMKNFFSDNIGEKLHTLSEYDPIFLNKELFIVSPLGIRFKPGYNEIFLIDDMMDETILIKQFEIEGINYRDLYNYMPWMFKEFWEETKPTSLDIE